MHWLHDSQRSLIAQQLSAPNDQGLFIIPSIPKHPWDTISLSLLGYKDSIDDPVMIRAYFESIVFQLKGFLSTIHRHYPQQLKTLYVDGIWCPNKSLLQLLSDILQIPVTQTYPWPSESVGTYRLLKPSSPALKLTKNGIHQHTAPMLDPISCYAPNKPMGKLPETSLLSLVQYSL